MLAAGSERMVAATPDYHAETWETYSYCAVEV